MARRSKYKFALLQPGETIKVDGIDVYSMLNSLKGYNKRAGSSIELKQIGDPDTKGRYTYQRES